MTDKKDAKLANHSIETIAWSQESSQPDFKAPISERDLFIRALQIESEDERQQFLAQACGKNLALLDCVQSLLQANESDGEMMIDRPLFSNQPIPVVENESLGPGKMMGPYELQELLGQGGMGEVWLAQQTKPIRRQVAIKLVRTGRETPGILQRFYSERQALAAMEHPNIARVFDADSTSTGRPFFVMELVTGSPLQEYCDQEKLTINERLRVFAKIADAVSHAHQKGIIHRDLKPSNVLVADSNGHPVPKVIDFGLAKALTGQVTLDSISTHFGGIIGTLEYMAPEQAGYDNQVIDTRADVYSMGVMLYELLSGLRPHDSTRFENVSVDEMLDFIKKVKPAFPSTRLSSSGDANQIANLRRIDSQRLSRMLKNELDWIVMKALEKDRERRYQSAREFADDVNRYLDGEPVLACPPSWSYRTTKFVSRNKGLVASVATIAAALILGMIGTTIGLLKANHNAALLEVEVTKSAAATKAALVEKAKAETARNEAIRAAEEETRQKRYAQAIADFVKDDFLALTTVRGRLKLKGSFENEDVHEIFSKETSLRNLLDRAAVKLKQRNDLEPLTLAELNWVVGVSYRKSGESLLAIPFLEETVEIRGRILGDTHPETLDALNSLAVAESSAGNNQAAKEIYLDVLEVLRSEKDQSISTVLTVMKNLSSSHRSLLEFREARDVSKKALDLSLEKLGLEDDMTISCKKSYGIALRFLGKHDESIQILSEVVAHLNKTPGKPSLGSLSALSSLGLSFVAAGNRKRAIEIFEKCVNDYQLSVGKNDTSYVTALHHLTGAYLENGQPADALPGLLEVVKHSRSRLGDRHPFTLDRMNSLGSAYHGIGKFEKASETFESAFEIMKTELGLKNIETIHTMNNLAIVYGEIGRHDEAKNMLETLVDVNEKTFDKLHKDTLRAIKSLAISYRRLGRMEDAITQFQKLADRNSEKFGDDNGDTLSAMHSLASTMVQSKKFSEAIPWMEKVADGLDAELGSDHPKSVDRRFRLAQVFGNTGQYEKAFGILDKLIERVRQMGSKKFPNYLLVLNNSAHVFVEGGDAAKAIELFKEVLDGAMQQWGEQHPRTITLKNDLGNAYFVAKQYELAIGTMKEGLELAKKYLEDDHRTTQLLTKNLSKIERFLDSKDAASKPTNDSPDK